MTPLTIEDPRKLVILRTRELITSRGPDEWYVELWGARFQPEVQDALITLEFLNHCEYQGGN